MIDGDLSFYFTLFSQPIRALYDFIEFDNAIAKAVEMTDPEETLILVSADHRFDYKFSRHNLNFISVTNSQLVVMASEEQACLVLGIIKVESILKTMNLGIPTMKMYSL